MSVAAKLTAHFKDRQALYKAYMPFVQHGGLFIRSDKSFALGDVVSVSLLLPDEKKKIVFDSRVIWINPLDSEHPKGVGVVLESSNEQALKKRIEGLLGDRLMSDQASDTL